MQEPRAKPDSEAGCGRKAGNFLILGVGNRMRSDDGVGSLVGEHFVDHGNVPAIDCSVAPENYLSRVLEMKPEEVILVDACDFGGIAGEFRVFEEADFDKVVYGLLLTHTMPLTLLTGLIKKELDCRVRLVGIQPQSIWFGEELTDRVQKALPKVIELIEKLVRA